MRFLVVRGLLALTSLRPAFGKGVVFWQDGFPTVESQPASVPHSKRRSREWLPNS